MKTKLFSPIRVRGVTLDNRIVVSPMVEFSAAEQGNASDWDMMHLGNLAVSGAGLVFTEATAVEPRGVVSAHCLGLWSDDNMYALARVIDFCRKHSPAKMGIQLQHAGRKGSVTKPWEKQVGLQESQGGWCLRAPSALPYPGREEVPEEISREGLKELEDLYCAALATACRAFAGRGCPLRPAVRALPPVDVARRLFETISR